MYQALQTFFCFGTNVNKIKGTVKTIAFDKICHNRFVTQDYDIFYNIAQVFCARIVEEPMLSTLNECIC